MTSLMLWLLVSNMTSLSIPIPSPPVGGMPCSSAVKNCVEGSDFARRMVFNNVLELRVEL